MRIGYVILIAFLVSACSGNVSEKRDTSVAVQSPPITESAAIPTDTFLNTPDKPVEAVPKPSTPSNDKSFKSAQEAYDEGYYNGQQEGYTDATHHLDFGYYYDDEPEYSGFLSAYVRGYEDGYRDGFREGLEWNSEND